jgi:hypothetical protein
MGEFVLLHFPTSSFFKHPGICHLSRLLARNEGAENALGLEFYANILTTLGSQLEKYNDRNLVGVNFEVN